MKCKICNNSNGHKEFTVKEMMFGFKDEFLYFYCNKCNCLQIKEIPKEISRYYPSNYYSFSNSINKKSNFINYLKLKRNHYAVFNRGLLGKLVYKFSPSLQHRILSEVKLNKNSKILDVGCGNGTLLQDLNNLGLKKLLGADPYIKKDIVKEGKIFIQKSTIHNITEKQDLIMFHHSFEHLEDPLKTLHSVSKLLNKGGCCIIRVPTISYAWKLYKENWVQLDAPRHFFIHSKESIKFLIENTSLTLEKTIYDSTGFQFWGSEQYLKDISLFEPKSYAINKDNSIFSKSDIKKFEKKSKELNKKQDGDSCAFILKKV